MAIGRIADIIAQQKKDGSIGIRIAYVPSFSELTGMTLHVKDGADDGITTPTFYTWFFVCAGGKCGRTIKQGTRTREEQREKTRPTWHLRTLAVIIFVIDVSLFGLFGSEKNTELWGK